MSQCPHLIAIATHSDTIHLISFIRKPAPQLKLLHSLKLQEQPSWISRSVIHRDLLYVTSWVHDKIFLVNFGGSDGRGMELVDEVQAGGGGPTYTEPTKDGKGLLVVHYRTSSLTYLPLLPNGHFDHSPASSTSNYTHVFPFLTPVNNSSLPHPRQDCSHPHHIIPLVSDEWLIPDLGNDVIWKMKWNSLEMKWIELDKFQCEEKSGPRHGVLLPGGELSHSNFGPATNLRTIFQTRLKRGVAAGNYLCVLNELSSSLSLVSIAPNHPNDLPRTIATSSLLPPSLRSVNPLEHDPKGFAMIASTILLLQSLDPNDLSKGSKRTILASNRDAPTGLAPHGDTFVQFSLTLPQSPASPFISASTLDSKALRELPILSEPTFHTGAGRHLRGLIVRSPSTYDRKSSLESSSHEVIPTAYDSLDQGEYVLVMGRDEGGLSLYERQWLDGKEPAEVLVPLLLNVLENEVIKPVGGVWLS